LSEGLRQAGVAETLWAIETNAIAAEAFYANHPNATVFTGDCNYLKQLLKVSHLAFIYIKDKPILFACTIFNEVYLASHGTLIAGLHNVADHANPRNFLRLAEQNGVG
jgi:hypothetical protein